MPIDDLAMFTTHNCLSKGIRKVTIQCDSSALTGDVLGMLMIDDSPVCLRLGRNSFLTIEGAKEKAEQMRIAKIRTLQNSIEKLQSMAIDG
jgi:hypothetical protein